MAEVHIPFKARFREPMLATPQVKTMTSRTRKMAEVGDTFRAFGATFLVTEVHPATYHVVLDCWKNEGCSSREDLKAIWREIHPRKQFKPDDLLWVHGFRRVEDKR